MFKGIIPKFIISKFVKRLSQNTNNLKTGMAVERERERERESNSSNGL
jgi:hypothetical protein